MHCPHRPCQTGLRCSRRIFPTGQTFSHTPHPLHFSSARNSRSMAGMRGAMRGYSHREKIRLKNPLFASTTPRRPRLISSATRCAFLWRTRGFAPAPPAAWRRRAGCSCPAWRRPIRKRTAPAPRQAAPQLGHGRSRHAATGGNAEHVGVGPHLQPVAKSAHDQRQTEHVDGKHDAHAGFLARRALLRHVRHGLQLGPAQFVRQLLRRRQRIAGGRKPVYPRFHAQSFRVFALFRQDPPSLAPRPRHAQPA